MVYLCIGNLPPLQVFYWNIYLLSRDNYQSRSFCAVLAWRSGVAIRRENLLVRGTFSAKLRAALRRPAPNQPLGLLLFVGTGNPLFPLPVLKRPLATGGTE